MSGVKTYVYEPFPPELVVLVIWELSGRVNDRVTVVERAGDMAPENVMVSPDVSVLLLSVIVMVLGDLGVLTVTDPEVVLLGVISFPVSASTRLYTVTPKLVEDPAPPTAFTLK
jgi:hypothetical protein